MGSDEIWDKAEAALAEATKLAGLDYILNPGEGAFYGPKSVQNECRRKMLAFFYDRAAGVSVTHKLTPPTRPKQKTIALSAMAF